MTVKNKLKRTLDKRTIEEIRDTILGELMTFMVDQFKGQKKAYNELNEDLQQSIIDKVHKHATTMIGQAVKGVAKLDYPGLSAEVATVAFKAGFIQVQLKVPESEELRHELSDSRGKKIIVVLADPDQFLEGANNLPKAEPDQGAIGFDRSPGASHD